MTVQPVRRREGLFRRRDALLFLPWVGALFAAFGMPQAGWSAFGPVACSAAPIMLYLILEHLGPRSAVRSSHRVGE